MYVDLNVIVWIGNGNRSFQKLEDYYIDFFASKEISKAFGEI